MRLIFIRHGDPNYQLDTLTERGWKEAEALFERVKKWKVDEFYVSPLGRARDTANVSLEKLNRSAETLDWLKEFFVPVVDPVTGDRRIAWDLMPAYWTEKCELYERALWLKSDIMQSGNVEEEYRRVCDSFDGLLLKHGYRRTGGYYKAEKGNNKTLVFFCHLGVQFVLLSHLFGVTAPVMWQNFFVAPTSVTELVTEEREKGIAVFRCKRIGDVSHLEAAGIEPSDSGFFNEVY